MLEENGNLSILFLGKKNDTWCEKALQFTKSNCREVEAHLGKWGEALPENIGWWEGEYIISYLSRWIVPEYLLKRAKIAAINFHPASPEYPGVGCNNFALYENTKEFGCTCHYMQPKVDTGDIIAVKRFPIFTNDDVKTLLHRTYDFQLALFYEIMGAIIAGKELPETNEQWGRKAFTRKELNELNVITWEMEGEEIKKRIRATNYMEYKPIVKIGEYEFELKA